MEIRGLQSRFSLGELQMSIYQWLDENTVILLENNVPENEMFKRFQRNDNSFGDVIVIDNWGFEFVANHPTPKMEHIKYALSSTELDIRYKDIGGYDGITASAVILEIFNNKISVQAQQLAELGALFLALAGKEGIDFASCDELLDGFCLKGKVVAQALADELEG